ncbi:lipopolysaccharide biosynthesis protein [soil metagenome]
MTDEPVGPMGDSVIHQASLSWRNARSSAAGSPLSTNWTDFSVNYGHNLLRRLRHRESDTHRDGAWHGILRNTGWLLTGKIVGAVLSLIYLGLATRSLGPTAFGQFVLILGTGQAIATIVSFETWQLLLRYGMGFLRAGQSDALGRLIAFCTILDMAGALIGACLAIVGVALLAPRFGWSSGTQTQTLIFCFALLVSFRSTATGVLRLHDRFGAAALAETVTPVVRLTGALLVIEMGASVVGLLIAWAVAELVTSIAHWALAFRVLPPRREWWHWQGLLAVPKECPGLWRYAAITNAGSTLGLVGKQFAVLLVGASVSPAAAGGYRIAHQLGQALANISDMLSRATFSEIMRARAGHTAAELARLFRSASLLALITAAIMIAMLLLLGRPTLALLAGAPYAPVYPLVLILGTAAALDAGSVSFEPALLATGRVWLALRLRLVSTAFLFGALFLFLDKMGTIGAAFATVTASLLALIMLGTAAWRAVHQPR